MVLAGGYPNLTQGIWTRIGEALGRLPTTTGERFHKHLSQHTDILAALEAAQEEVGAGGAGEKED
jgi:hypothetical protein